tara:strand:- start:2629 stop:3375 length:747 start_codon:yes stop_codon:yes gene_type:complete
MHPYFEGYNFYGFVHRGGDEEKTENTLEAFQYSSDLGFIFIETDVQITKDNQIVIFHDENLKRMAGISKEIRDLEFEEIKKIDLINGGKIPLLKEALISFPNLRFNIDIKKEKAVDETIKIINSLNCLNRVCLASFSSKRLKRIRALAGPNACTSSGQMEVFKLVSNSIGINIGIPDGDCVQVPTSQWGVPIITKGFIESVHELGKLIHVWTIDHEPEMNNLIELGIDGLMTDKPSVLKRTLQKKGLF